MIKAVIFDCFGVLTKDMWREFCETLPQGEVLQKARELNYQYDAGKLELESLVEQVHDLTGRDRQIIKKIYTNPDGAKNILLLDYIKELKAKYKIGMLSNVATNWVTEVFLSQDEQKLFDAMVFSFEVGAIKPDPKMYEAILAKLGVEATDSVFIDDQPRYCDGAKALGMQAIWYQDFEQMKSELEKILTGSTATNN